MTTAERIATTSTERLGQSYDWRLAGRQEAEGPQRLALSGIDFKPDELSGLFEDSEFHLLSLGTTAVTPWLPSAALEVALEHYYPLNSLFAYVDAEVEGLSEDRGFLIRMW